MGEIVIVAVWGFLGAFVYAGPKLVACVYSAKSSGAGWSFCAVTFIVAMVIGPIMAAAFVPMIAAFIARTAEHDVRALATVVGMIANPIAPDLVKRMSGKVLKKLSQEESE
jgi:hypothetical protein